MFDIQCSHCHKKLETTVVKGGCPECGSPIDFKYSSSWETVGRENSMWRYRNLLPIQDTSHIVSLGEGNTPLIKSRIPFVPNVYLKDESRNPTGSMKDRAMSVAYSKAKELNIQRSILVSAGGAGIAASAYASRAGIQNYILIPPGVSHERMMAMQIYGSELIEIQGNIEDCLDVVTELVDEFGWYETTTYKKANPYTSEGPKTIAFELFEQCAEIPDYVFVPVGGGGTLGGIWRGFCELKEREQITKIPKLIAVQNTKFNGLEIAIEKGYTTDEQLHLVDIDSTVPTVTAALRHSYVPDGVEALMAIRDTKGQVVTVTDEEAMKGQQWIAGHDGLFVEPGSATTLIAYKKMLDRGDIKAQDSAVLILTGSGYREVSTTVKYHGRDPKRLTVDECFNYLSKKS